MIIMLFQKYELIVTKAFNYYVPLTGVRLWNDHVEIKMLDKLHQFLKKYKI